MSVDNLAVISVFIVIYTIYAMFAFKTISISGKIEVNRNSYYEHKNNDFLRHKQYISDNFWDIVLNSSVCKLGTFGATVLFLWSSLLVGFLLFYQSENRSLVIKILASINLIFFIVYSGLTYLMNWPLFVRCIPYLLLQFAISIWMYFI